MAKLAPVRRVVIIFIICSLSLSFIAILTKSQTPTAIPTLDPARIPQMPVYSGGLVTGFVLDENGNPVSCAIVTLWQDGPLWQHTKLIYSNGDVNPKASDIYGNSEGLFLFGLVSPGQYVLTAEKEGHVASVNLSVGNDTAQMPFGGTLDIATNNVNITIKGYDVPVLSQVQLSYGGAITGTLLGRYGTRVIGVNVSLWQDGQIVKMPKNPQSSFRRNVSGREVDYLFEHLTPGEYQVMAEYAAPFTSNDSVTVNVSNGLATADIVLSQLYLTPPPTLPPESTLPTPVPSPAPGIAAVLPSIGVAILIMGISRRTR